MTKKILCIIFCMMMFLTVLPVTVFSLNTLETNDFFKNPILTQEPSFPVFYNYPLEITKKAMHKDVLIDGIDDNIIDMIQQIDESLVLEYLEELVSFGPRVTGSAACIAAGEWIYNEFQSMGLSVRYHNWTNSGYTSKNIEATIYGTENEDEIYIICGHYDSVSGSPGADDDGSGVVAAMVAAYIMSEYIFNYTIRFVTFSGEEQGLLGSEKYAQDAAAQGDNIVGVLNADMIGFAPNPGDNNSVKIYENAASEWLYTFTNNVNNVYDEYIQLDLIHSGEAWNSDHASFWQFGYDAIMYHEYNFNDYYHSPGDTIAHMNIEYNAKIIKLMLATLAELAQPNIPSNPPDTPVITGPTMVTINEVCKYTVVTTDPDGDDVYYYVDWGDGTSSDWIGPYNSGVPIQTSHIWTGLGSYMVRVRAKDIYGVKSSWSGYITVIVTDNRPPNAPIINGPNRGKVGVTYEYEISSTDPDGHDVYFFVFWGDGGSTGWIGPYNSSEVVVLNHKWDKKGTYTISVKVKDVGDYESTWTQLKITMPRNTMPVNFLLYYFLQHLQLLKNKITDFFILNF